MKGIVPLIAVAIILLIVFAYMMGFFPSGILVSGSYNKVCWDIDNKGGHVITDPCVRTCEETWVEAFTYYGDCDAYHTKMLNTAGVTVTSCTPWTDPIRGGKGYSVDVKKITKEPYPNPACPSPTTTTTTLNIPATLPTVTTTSYITTTTRYVTTTTVIIEPPVEKGCGWNPVCYITNFLKMIGNIFKS